MSALQAGKHSLLHHYAPSGKDRRKAFAPRVTPIVIDDPYAADHPAMPRKPPAGSKAHNASDGSTSAHHEWEAQPKKPIEVFASSRDIVAGMFARRQIDRPMFLAARDYQGLYEKAMSPKVKTVDPSMPPISGGRGREAIDGQCAAADRLAHIERRLAERHGGEAVGFVREVLGQGLTIERAAIKRGDGDKQLTVKWWGGLFRRCLKHLAEISGFAVTNAYRNRRREERRRETERKRMEREDADGSR